MHIVMYVRRLDDGTHRSSQANDGAASDVRLFELVSREHLLVLNGIARGANLEELHVIAKSSPAQNRSCSYTTMQDYIQHIICTY